MADYRLSRKAREDLNKIAEYSLENFGLERAKSYRNELLSALDNIARHPELGARMSDVKPETRRYLQTSHMIYYRSGSPVFIRRILHQSQDPLRHL